VFFYAPQCTIKTEGASHVINPYPGARRQNQTEMFSDHDETSPSIAAVSAPSTACSMLVVQQQKRLYTVAHLWTVDVSAARRGCHTMRRVYRPEVSTTDVCRRSEMYSGVCPGPEATCELASFTGSSRRLATRATTTILLLLLKDL